MSVQMDRQVPDLYRFEIGSREETDELVLRYLRDTANAAGIAYASKRSLATALPISTATALRAIDRLVEAGELEVVSKSGGRYLSRYRVLTAIPTTPAA